MINNIQKNIIFLVYKDFFNILKFFIYVIFLKSNFLDLLKNKKSIFKRFIFKF
jgi:hypothetical protein